MRQTEKGAVSILVIITLFSFTSILMGTYISVMALQKSQLESNVKMQQVYGDNLNNIEEIYETIISEKQISISYEPNGEEKDYGEGTLQSVLSVANIEDEDVSIYYSWNESNKEEPTAWEECENDETVENSNDRPGTYYLWGRVYDTDTQEVLKTKVSEKFIVAEKQIENIDINYNWEKKYEWGIGDDNTSKYYQIVMNITNDGETQNGWQLQFDVQPGIVIQNCNVWCANLEQIDDNTISLKSYDWNSQITEGGTLNLEFILAFNNPKEIQINNVKFNGKIIGKE